MLVFQETYLWILYCILKRGLFSIWSIFWAALSCLCIIKWKWYLCFYNLSKIARFYTRGLIVNFTPHFVGEKGKHDVEKCWWNWTENKYARVSCERFKKGNIHNKLSCGISLCYSVDRCNFYSGLRSSTLWFYLGNCNIIYFFEEI